MDQATLTAELAGIRDALLVRANRVMTIQDEREFLWARADEIDDLIGKIEEEGVVA